MAARDRLLGIPPSVLFPESNRVQVEPGISIMLSESPPLATSQGLPVAQACNSGTTAVPTGMEIFTLLAGIKRDDLKERLETQAAKDFTSSTKLDPLVAAAMLRSGPHDIDELFQVGIAPIEIFTLVTGIQHDELQELLDGFSSDDFKSIVRLEPTIAASVLYHKRIFLETAKNNPSPLDAYTANTGITGADLAKWLSCHSAKDFTAITNLDPEVASAMLGLVRKSPLTAFLARWQDRKAVKLVNMLRDLSETEFHASTKLHPAVAAAMLRSTQDSVIREHECLAMEALFTPQPLPSSTLQYLSATLSRDNFKAVALNYKDGEDRSAEADDSSSSTPGPSPSHSPRDVLTDLFMKAISDQDIPEITFALSYIGDANLINQMRHDGKTALTHAVLAQSMSIVDLLAQHGADVNATNSDNTTPLYWATALENIAIVRALLGYNASTEIQGYVGKSSEASCAPLHAAAALGCKDIAQELLDHGAAVDLPAQRTFDTPLLYAVRHERHNVVVLLLDRGADPDGDSRSQRSPLIEATARNDKTAVDILLQYGADVDRVDEDNNSALHIAARKGYKDIVDALLEGRMDGVAECLRREGIADRPEQQPVALIDLKGKFGRPAWWLAREAGHTDIADMLRARALQSTCDFPKDIPNDFDTPFSAFPDDQFLLDLERAQRCIMPQPSETLWKKRLRFVIPASPPTSEYDLDLIEPYCEADHNPAADEPYVGVSYCWSSYTTEYPPLTIRFRKANGEFDTRKARAGTELLRRSLAFAAANGIKRVWIDQECIHQDDLEDKGILLGVMHKIYQQAKTTVVVLGRHISSFDDIISLLKCSLDPLPVAAETSGHSFHIKHTAPVMDRLFADKWFMRAWTVQESLNAKEVAFLVGWDVGYDQSAGSWRRLASFVDRKFETASQYYVFPPKQSVPGEFVLYSQQLLKIGINRGSGKVGHLAQRLDTPETRTFTLCNRSRIEAMSWWRNDGDTQWNQVVNLPEDSSCQPSDEIAPLLRSLQLLKDKKSLLVSDKLAILANLSHYPLTLNIAQVIEERISFTACTIALALSNGDSSILTCYQPHGGRSHSASSWLPSTSASNAALSMGYTPVLATGSPEERHLWMAEHVITGSPILVFAGSLLVRGVFWEIKPFSGFLKLRSFLCDYLQTYGSGSRMDRFQAGLILLVLVVREIFESQQLGLLELIVTVERTERLSSPAEMQTILNKLKAWHHSEALWPTEVTNARSVTSQVVGGLVARSEHIRCDLLEEPPEPVEAVTLPFEWGSDILRLIFYTIYLGIPLPVGELNIGNEKLLGIFALNRTKHSQVFVPVDELNYNFQNDHASMSQCAHHNFWCVSPSGKTVSSDRLSSAQGYFGERFSKEGLQFSKEIIRNDGATNLFGMWSPRLSAEGLLTWDDAIKSWSMIPLGQAAVYHFIE